LQNTLCKLIDSFYDRIIKIIGGIFNGKKKDYYTRKKRSDQEPHIGVQYYIDKRPARSLEGSFG